MRRPSREEVERQLAQADRAYWAVYYALSAVVTGDVGPVAEVETEPGEVYRGRLVKLWALSRGVEPFILWQFDRAGQRPTFQVWTLDEARAVGASIGDLRLGVALLGLVDDGRRRLHAAIAGAA